MLSTGVHFVNVNLVMPWNSLLLRTLRLHGIATFTSMLKSTFHSMTCLDPVTEKRRQERPNGGSEGRGAGVDDNGRK